jgi:acyl dehydratase
MPEKSIEELKESVGTSRVTIDGLAVEAGKVAEFASALKDENPAYRSEEVAAERGLDGIPAPLTFTQIGRFPHYQPDGLEGGIQGFDLGFDPERTLHGEQEYEFKRPLFVGDSLTGTTTLTDVYQRETDGGTLTFAVLTTEYRTDNGDLVLTERRTAIET